MIIDILCQVLFAVFILFFIFVGITFGVWLAVQFKDDYKEFINFFRKNK